MVSKLFAAAALLAALIGGEWQSGLLKKQIKPWAAEFPYSSLINLYNYFEMVVMPQQVRLLEHVLQNAKRNDPADVIAKVDEFGWKWPTMNVGDVKGQLVDEALEKMGDSAKVVVELGSYLGYSTVRLASLLRRTSSKAVLYSVDPNPLGHAVKLALLDHAGLIGPQVRNELNYSDAVIKRLAAEGKQIDYLFIDHLKALYQSDVELAVQLGALRKGSVLVADNVLSPGAPEYREWMLANKQFKTTVHLTKLEYCKEIPDEVLISTFLG